MYEFNNFEWNEEKQAITLDLRGLDFADSWIIFEDEFALTLESNQNDEVRYKTIGKLNEKLIVIIHAPRAGNCRIISMRRARKNEEDMYNDENI